MENIALANDQIRLKLLDKCFNLGLPASTKDDINTLKMYLDVDSKLDIDDFNFQIETVKKENKSLGFKSILYKLLSISFS
jgi:hypothetical protein